MLLYKFCAWGQAIESVLNSLGIFLVLSEPIDSPNPCVRLDFDSEENVARIALWESGECELEIINMNSGITTFCEHKELDQESRFEAEFLAFLNCLCPNC